MEGLVHLAGEVRLVARYQLEVSSPREDALAVFGQQLRLDLLRLGLSFLAAS